MKSERRDRKPAWRLIAIAIATVVIFVVAGAVLMNQFGTSNKKLLAMAHDQLANGEYAKAGKLAGQVLQDSPKSTEALIIAGQAVSALKREDLALNFFGRVEYDGSDASIEAIYQCGRILFEMGNSTGAEKCLRRVLEHDPAHVETNNKLMYLLRMSARNWEIREYFMELLKQEQLPVMTLAAAAVTELAWSDRNDNELMQRFRSSNDVLFKLVQARKFLTDNRHEDAKGLLKEIVSERPDLIQAHAWLGEILVASDSPAEFVDWHRKLQASADWHPGIWHARGLWYKKQGEMQHAARCFWEVLQRHPNHMGANYQLAQALNKLDRAEDARPFSERSRQLANLEYLVQEVRLREIAEQLKSLGRHWESVAWCRAILQHGSESDQVWARTFLEQVSKDLDTGTPLTLAASNPASNLDLANYPLPDWDSMEYKQGAEQVADNSGGRVSFIDSAAESGLKFSYHNGADPDHAYMFEFSGGGVAVLDFDVDGWPDLYLTQGCPWPPKSDEQEYRDRLFRNLGNGRFEDVTDQSGLDNNGFGQGATVGDYDSDGFPDLYVANIGANRFYRNNGDGTFSDVTQQTGIAGGQWTLSCLVADLNGDSLPDIYDVNYLGGPDVFTRICPFRGKPIQCPPTFFPAEQDQVYINLGDGRFENVTETSGIVAPEGKGMGIIAADFTGNGRLSLFVSNDTTANFFFVNETKRGEHLAFKERALLTGLAYNNSGHADSCMGIAAGDTNNDARLDLFVTNFDLESNNLFVQLQDLLFEDNAQQAKLGGPSYELMGWGTQFLDGELDGRPDLVVANGQLDDYPHNQPRVNKMPTQYFQNGGGGKFKETSSKQLGPYFEEKYLGRAITRLDWNRDGLEDFCVTHVHAPLALLTNQTEVHGHYLAVTLRGVDSDRDAIGTKVRVSAGEQSWTRQLIAGDGFQASNERQLVFGLGEREAVDELTVVWPSGKEQTFQDLKADHQFMFIEGADEPYLMTFVEK